MLKKGHEKKILFVIINCIFCMHSSNLWLCAIKLSTLLTLILCQKNDCY